MSYVSTFNAFQVSGISKAEQHVLTAICTFADKNGVCWPTTETIAARCLSSVRTVQKHINGLVSKGLLERIYRKGRPATTKVLIPLAPTPATSAPLPPQLLRGEPVTESVSIKTAAAAKPLPAAASAALVVVEIEQPEQPTAQDILATEEKAKESAINCTAAAQDPRELQPTDTITEAHKTPVEPSNEPDGTDPLASVPQAILDDWAEVRKAKKKAPKANRSEVKVLQAEARLAGLSMEQLILGMVLRGWTHYSASWGSIKPVPIEATPVVSKLWEPEPHTPASASTVSRMKEKIAEMKARWKEDSLKSPPMRQ